MLELRNVTKRYGAFTALSQINFSVRPGEVVGYLGPNGSGKSTTVRMLAGLMPPSLGQIFLDGRDIQDDVVAYKSHVGYVPEEAHLYTYLTAPEYLRLCGRLRGIEEQTLGKKIDRFLRIFSLDTDRHVTLVSFSKGMRQKVLLAAALLHNPRIIILDEPTSGLDVSTGLVLSAVVRALARDNRLIFYSSHELDAVEQISTRVIILRSGKIVADDSVYRLRELMRSPSLMDVFSQLAIDDDVDRAARDVIEAARL